MAVGYSYCHLQMKTLKELEKEVRELQERNTRVELDKAWETSSTRKVSIAVLTYAVVVLFFFIANLPEPFINAMVPTAGFVLSTLSLPVIKATWVKTQKK